MCVFSKSKIWSSLAMMNPLIFRSTGDLFTIQFATPRPKNEICKAKTENSCTNVIDPNRREKKPVWNEAKTPFLYKSRPKIVKQVFEIHPTELSL